jgi:hypothetical protein
MQYSLNQIQTVEQCNALLSILNKDKEATQSKLGMQKISIDRHESTTEETFSELAASQPMLDSLNPSPLTPKGGIKNPDGSESFQGFYWSCMWSNFCGYFFDHIQTTTKKCGQNFVVVFLTT